MDSSTNAVSGAAAAGIFGFVIVYFLFLAAMCAFIVWVYWRIFTKAGYNGALAFLNLIPGVGTLVCILVLAFGRWPIEDALAASGGRLAPPGSAPAPGSTLST